jgi:hypothetical protein
VKTRILSALLLAWPALVAAQPTPRPAPAPAPVPRVAPTPRTPIPPRAPRAPRPPEAPEPPEPDWPDIPEVTDDMLRGLDAETRDMVRKEMAKARGELERAKREYRDAMKEAGRAQREAAKQWGSEWKEEWKDREKEWKEREKEWKDRAKDFAKRGGHDDDWDGWDDGDDEEWDNDWHDAGKPSKPSNQTFPMNGPATLEISAGQADVIIRTGAKAQVVVAAPGCPQGQVEIDHDGSSVEISLPWGCTGKVVIDTPAGTKAEVQTGEGTVQLDGQYGDVEVQTVGGSIRIGRARNVEVETVQGNVNLTGVGGRASVQTVAGKIAVVSTEPATRVEAESVSGDIEWRGLCKAGCRVDGRTMSGSLTVTPQAGSSYAFGVSAPNGTFTPPPFLKVETENKTSQRTRTLGNVGSGEGRVRIRTHSGRAQLKQI